ncbi:MAG: HlyU family transcriptional regulator [Alphaproteobacteria bacterium]
MFGFLSKWFERGEGDAAAAGEAVVYRGFTITPQPYRRQGQWQLAARITKEIAGETREHQLVRADLLSDPQEARRHAVMKAQRLIDERGDGLFD